MKGDLPPTVQPAAGQENSIAGQVIVAAWIVRAPRTRRHRVVGEGSRGHTSIIIDNEAMPCPPARRRLNPQVRSACEADILLRSHQPDRQRGGPAAALRGPWVMAKPPNPREPIQDIRGAPGGLGT